MSKTKCLRSICGLRQSRIRNRVNQNVRKGFGHVERMSDERLVKKIHISEISGNKREGKPHLGELTR